MDDQVAILHTSSTEACFANAALVAALLTECSVMALGTGVCVALYASVIQDLIAKLIADVDIFLPLGGGEC